MEILETSTQEFPSNKLTKSVGEFVVLSTVIVCEKENVEKNSNMYNFFIIKKSFGEI